MYISSPLLFFVFFSSGCGKKNKKRKSVPEKEEIPTQDKSNKLLRISVQWEIIDHETKHHLKRVSACVEANKHNQERDKSFEKDPNPLLPEARPQHFFAMFLFLHKPNKRVNYTIITVWNTDFRQHHKKNIKTSPESRQKDGKWLEKKQDRNNNIKRLLIDRRESASNRIKEWNKS